MTILSLWGRKLDVQHAFSPILRQFYGACLHEQMQAHSARARMPIT